MHKVRVWLLLIGMLPGVGFSEVRVGLDRVFQEDAYVRLLKGKKVTLITHHAAINHEGKDALSVFIENQHICALKALCTLEHGYYGTAPVETPGMIPDLPGVRSISLYGKKNIPECAVEDSDVLVYDIQDIGVRSYTFILSLLHLVRASEAYNKPLLVLDRPNPMGGNIVDGPLPKSRDEMPEIPYCYGMTPGELALFYQAKYAPGASVHVIPMKGWRRSMTFEQTGLPWIPTSPQIPEPQTAFFYAATGIIGSLSMASIGVGYTLPFRVIGAPWMDGDRVAECLNTAKLPGVSFYPFCYEPFFGKYKMENCSGVLLLLKDPTCFLPMETQCAILGVLKSLYPEQMEAAFKSLDKLPVRYDAICRFLGDTKFMHICRHERYILWPLKQLCVEGRTAFLSIRKPFLLAEYEDGEI